jgi:glyoxylase-like metal-dependent hydrolase (beta-lactamase superfamily II)
MIEATPIRAWGQGIFCVDAQYLRAGFDAIHVVIESGRAAIIDSGTQASVPIVLKALKELGLDAHCVDWVILTHIHLDHAGGAGALMRHLPHARLIAHHRGAPHMIDPTRLWAGAVNVYGAAQAQALYGTLIPIPQERVVAAEDGAAFDLGGRTLICLDAPGHARHHLVVQDQVSGSLFTGDAFGLSYRELDVGGRAFVLPSTTPVQFDPEAMTQTIRRLLALRPPAVYLTHWSRLEQVAEAGAQLLHLVQAYTTMARAVHARVGTDPAVLQPALETGMSDLLLQALAEHGCTLPRATQSALLDLDIRLNAAGLLTWLTSTSNRP